jgi:hypothetical protein
MLTVNFPPKSGLNNTTELVFVKLLMRLTAVIAPRYNLASIVLLNIADAWCSAQIELTVPGIK